MRVKTEIGEIGINDGEKTYILKPSFKNIAEIGSPKEIIKIMRDLAGIEYKPELASVGFYNDIYKKDLFETARNVLDCCGYTGDLMGYYSGLRYNAGKMPYNDVIIIAAALMQAGTIGKPTKRQGQKKQDIEEFNTDDLVLMACKNLGISKKEAEDLTLIQLQRALDILYPAEEEKIAGSDVKSGDYDEAMKKAKQMMERSLKNG